MFTSRANLLSELFPEGVPSLWCPPLTHYQSTGAIDRTRMAAHLAFMGSWSKGLLVPGTTGDGWELSPEEIRELTALVLDEAQRLRLHLLLGALHPDAPQAKAMIRQTLAVLQERSGTADPLQALRQNRVCGFAVCPPRGAHLTQSAMRGALCGLLELGVPLALYQLPQITENEMNPELVADLAQRFPHFCLFKDTSGTDRVGLSGKDLGGVFLVRGMEGDYARWLKAGGGCYDGFLLSSANTFGATLHDLRTHLAGGRMAEARQLSDRLSKAVQALFQIVAPVQGGNAFANANKLADHWYAHGPGADRLPPPRLHSGSGLTAEMVVAAGEVLREYGLMPDRGYLAL